SDNLGDGAPHPPGISVGVVRLAVDLRLHHIEQVLGTRQAAAVGGQNALRTPLHSHIPLLFILRLTYWRRAQPALQKTLDLRPFYRVFFALRPFPIPLRPL